MGADVKQLNLYRPCRTISPLAVWSSGMNLASGARGPGFNSQNSPFSYSQRQRPSNGGVRRRYAGRPPTASLADPCRRPLSCLTCALHLRATLGRGVAKFQSLRKLAARTAPRLRPTSLMLNARMSQASSGLTPRGREQYAACATTRKAMNSQIVPK